jgi:hypothetical protein
MKALSIQSFTEKREEHKIDRFVGDISIIAIDVTLALPIGVLHPAFSKKTDSPLSPT